MTGPFRWGDDQTFFALAGQVGTGKTHLAVARIMAVKNLDGCRFIDEGQFFEAWQDAHDAYRHRDSDMMRPNEYLRDLAYCSLLVIDDFGVQRPTQQATVAMLRVLGYRYANQLPTILTTNCKFSELVPIYGARTVSRIQDGRKFWLEGEDQRGRPRLTA